MTDSAHAAEPPEPAAADADARVRAATGSEPARTFDHDRIREGVRAILEGLGLDADDPVVKDTPERFARMCDEVFAGLLVDPRRTLDVVFEEGHDELIMERDIPVAAICEHHLLPLVGRAHVGYLPNKQGQITGVSKLARLVDIVCKRPNLQERITTTVADVLEEALEPRGVICVIEAEHMCMSMRGVKKPGAVTVTSAVRGAMRDSHRTREEAMTLAFGHRRLGT